MIEGDKVLELPLATYRIIECGKSFSLVFLDVAFAATEMKKVEALIKSLLEIRS